MITCTRRLTFCAGHRVMGHESKCATPHGHNYIVEITACAEKLDEVGRVIDFSVLKEVIGSWIDLNWDHTFLVYEEDRETIKYLNKMPSKKAPYVCSFNPTAENIANFLLKELCPQLLVSYGVEVTKVVVQETENCSAEASK